MHGIPDDLPKNEAVEIEIVVDRSGSMGSVITDTIGGYNKWLADQQALPGAANLTLTLFDNQFILEPTVPLADAKPLTAETYVPRGSTALNDAIGRALGRLEAKAPTKAILVVLTDGQENASIEFNTETIKAKIQAAQDRGWQVVYLSSDLSAFQDAANYGILRGTTQQVTASGAGMRDAFAGATTLNSTYRGS